MRRQLQQGQAQIITKQPLKDLTQKEVAKPIKISWILDISKLNQKIGETKGEEEETKSNPNNSDVQQNEYLSGSKFGLCHCPGKKLAKGRDGKVHDRDLKQDIEQFKVQNKVQTIVCLLNEYELRSIGVDLKLYKRICLEKDINFIHYPLIEMSVPECANISEFDEGIVKIISNELSSNKNVICHCRGGIGRAGLMASCLLLKYKIQPTWTSAIQFVRSTRDKRCVESRKQETFVMQYQVYLEQKDKLDPKKLQPQLQ